MRGSSPSGLGLIFLFFQHIRIAMLSISSSSLLNRATHELVPSKITHPKPIQIGDFYHFLRTGWERDLILKSFIPYETEARCVPSRSRSGFMAGFYKLSEGHSLFQPHRTRGRTRSLVFRHSSFAAPSIK